MVKRLAFTPRERDYLVSLTGVWSAGDLIVYLGDTVLDLGLVRVILKQGSVVSEHTERSLTPFRTLMAATILTKY